MTSTSAFTSASPSAPASLRHPKALGIYVFQTMRLLQVDENGEFSLTDDLFNAIPPYAILSHTWGEDHEEVSFRDLTKGPRRPKAGFRKLRFCAQQAARHGLRYFWVDTCCINKSNESELSEAIRSMFRWYRNAARCYVYLQDVRVRDADAQQLLWEPDFVKSRWFERGWTLQELLAPASVEFFSYEMKRLGDKQSLERQICERTKIPTAALRGSPLSSFSIQERLSWARERHTKREEDAVYSLLGLFEVHMPILYSEGKENATRRLLQEIQSHSSSPDTQTTPHSTVPFQRDRDFVEYETLLLPTPGHPPPRLQALLLGLGRITEPLTIGLGFAKARWRRVEISASLILLVMIFLLIPTLEDTSNSTSLPMTQNSMDGYQSWFLLGYGKARSTKEHEPALRTWLGDICTDVHTEKYNYWRAKLATSAYFGDWDGVWKALSVGSQQFGESWVNAVNIKSRNVVNETSLWTPLHQAVYNEAPIEVVRRLLDMGAFRTLRTRRTEFSEHDMTPLELAYDLKRSYLYDLLLPVTLSPLPLPLLSALEARLHSLIRRDLKERIEGNRTYIPSLEVLTEIRMEPIWFPVNTGAPGAGYAIRLDQRDLIVRAVNIPMDFRETTYRITKDETNKIEEHILYERAKPTSVYMIT